MKARLLAAAVLFPLGATFDHTVVVFEITEIVLFAAFWVVQTVELWNRTVRPRHPTQRSEPSRGDDTLITALVPATRPARPRRHRARAP